MHSAKDSSAVKGGYNFGTFSGVYTPALLTILGLVMFMRINYVIGNGGVYHTLLILVIGSSITLATVFSISAIATNLNIGGGGAYYLISRVLGPSFGTTIGVTLFISQTLAIAFNILGATEALVSAFPDLREYFPLLNVGIGLLLGLLVWRGADWAIKAQFFIMAILGVSILCFLLGPLPHFSTQTFMENLTPAPGGISSITLFSLFFPAVTGIMAGVNMSGDLKAPHISIPRGTFLAFGTAIAIYLLQIFVAAGCFDRQAMIEQPYLLLCQNALFGMSFMILAGVQAATLSTALGWLLGAPRVLQSLGVDNAIPGIVFFKPGVGPQNEPRRAILFVVILCVPLLLWCGFMSRDTTDISYSPINVVSELVSLFFLFTYAIINLAAFVESVSANPSFRPRFRFFHWSIAAYGAAACCTAAFLIAPGLSILAAVILLALYIWVRYRNLEMAYGDARRGFIYSTIHTLLLQLPSLPLHSKNWRPTIVAICNAPEERGSLIDYAVLFSQRRGILSVVKIVVTPSLTDINKKRAPMLHAMRELAVKRNWPIFPSVLLARTFDDGLCSMLQCHSLDPIRPNIILMYWPSKERRVVPFYRHLRIIVDDFKRNVIVLANEADYVPVRPRHYNGWTIDIWWESANGGSLMTILGYLIQLDSGWKKTSLRIFVRQGKKPAEKIARVLDRARIDAEVICLEPDAKVIEQICTHSCEAELIFADFPYYNEESDEEKMKMNALIKDKLTDMPPCFFVISNGEADLLA